MAIAEVKSQGYTMVKGNARLKTQMSRRSGCGNNILLVVVSVVTGGKGEV